MKRFLLPALLLAVAPAAWPASPPPFLHGLFTDGMVLQRDRPVPVWGWAAPGREVTVRIAGREARARADARGRWQATLPALPAGGPHTLEVRGPATRTVHDVAIGDVWLCSGQSNMEMGLKHVDMPQEIAAADHPGLRLFTVPRRTALEPVAQVEGRWLRATPENVVAGPRPGGFSAACYFLGRDLHRELGVPIGLVEASWGGTPAEAWTSAEALATMDDFREAVAALRAASAERRRGEHDPDRARERWWARHEPGSAGFPGQAAWAAPGLDARGWKAASLPGRWEDSVLPGFDGVVWFRREFTLPAGLAGRDLALTLGPIDDEDTTWINGVRVGETRTWDAPREYRVPARVLRPGRNVIAVRVLDTGQGGGFHGQARDMALRAPGGATLPLAGEWRYRASTPLDRLATLPRPVDDASNPAVLYNGMIAGLVPFAIKGAAWYQGEANIPRPAQYRRLLSEMIADWRDRFGGGDFPFHIVQLASFLPRVADPVQPGWAELREAQALVARDVPGVRLVVTLDVGDADDIHPKDKRSVGRRLALGALARDYGRPVAHQGPLLRAVQVRGDTLRLAFDHAEGGLVADGGGAPRGFAVAGADGRFVHAEAVIEGDTVVLRSPRVAAPVAARYGWANNPDATLRNRAGLPAAPFRTDGPA